MLTWGVGIASEKKMRVEAAELVGDNLCAELAPFSFSHQDGGHLIKEAPFAFIPDLWHNGAIPDDEVWLKLGGDKGGGTFKMCFQHLNVPTPNAPQPLFESAYR